MKNINRRDFVKMTGSVAAGLALSQVSSLKNAFAQAPVIGSTYMANPSELGSCAKVYFTKNIDANHLIKLYDIINEGVYGKVAIKLHTGEPHGPNILPRDMVKAFKTHIPDSTIVETNTLYQGGRYTTEDHRKTLQINGWDFSPVDIMDEDGDTVLPVRNGKHLKEVSMGAHLTNYDSMVVLTHFKGHAMGGFGGSLKNIAIGCASGQVGKRQVHGVVDQMPADFNQWPMQDYFMELLADSGKATVDYFGKHIIYLNVMRKMSVDCDCAGINAAAPTIGDIGIVASTDILAVDQASIDMVYQRIDNHDLVERIESRHGLHQLAAMRDLKMGNARYELISID
jgi:uncharacterized protein